MVTLPELAAMQRQFADERDWAQFHRPRNLDGEWRLVNLTGLDR